MSIGIVMMGLLIGFMVGVTGIGGATLLTPILIFTGVQPTIAIGTDLFYNSITKFFGTIQHYRQRTINWNLVKLFSCGSIPGAIIAIFLLQFCEPIYKNQEQFLKVALGYVLIFVSVSTLINMSTKYKFRYFSKSVQREKWIPILVGFCLGIIVGLTSIGSGSLFTLAMLLLYRMSPSELVGTDIAHALCLVTAAGLMHAGIGNVDYYLVFNLIVGSVPGVLLGSKIAHVLPPTLLKILMIFIIALSGLKLVF